MRVGSLFTGAGGLDLAVRLLWPDAELAWWSEVDEAASASFARHTDAPNLGDVTDIDWTQVAPVDVLVGGFPCQDLSQAGARAGLSGDRSGLWWRMVEAIDVLRPRLVLLENVRGIYSAKGGDDDDVDVDRDVLDAGAGDAAGALGAVLGSLADLGFDAEWGLLRAADVGAPHNRARWFCVAYDPDRTGGREAVEPDGGGTSEVDGAGVPDEPDRDVDGRRPDGAVSLLPTPTASDPWTDGLASSQVSDGSKHSLTLPGAVNRLLPTPTVSQGRNETSGRQPDAQFNTGTTLQDVAYASRWGEYARAIRRWERLTGTTAPDPTDDQGRLSPAFTEWMMGWESGWTAGTRAQRLKMCGNGVVPLQAAHAYRQLLHRTKVPS